MQRKHLSMESLLRLVRTHFSTLPTPPGCSITTTDCLMSGLAVYGLKAPSLLKFGERLQDENCKKNIKNLYHIGQIPSDTYLRERLDVIDPQSLRRAFTKVFAVAQRGKIIEPYQYLDNYYLLSLDGSGYFSSHEVSCKHCCVKQSKNGKVTYYHQAMGAVLVHPDIPHVIPLMPEFIHKHDGASKNDCERNASQRLLHHIRREHPHLNLMVVEDGLASNEPHLKLLDTLNMRYIIGAKEGDHKFLFDWVRHGDKTAWTFTEGRTTHTFAFVNGVPLNEAHFDYQVNFLAYTQTDPKGKVTTWSWVTNFTITRHNAYAIMRGGRARWHVENQTFNTLKNQGYQFEHNFGHGYEHLCSTMAVLMFLIFLIDQIQMLACASFQAAKKRLGSYISLWEEMRVAIRYFIFESWEALFCRITYNPP